MKIAIDARMYGNAECTGIGTYLEQLTKALFALDDTTEYVLFLRGEAYEKFTPPRAGVTKALVTPRWYSYGEQLLLPWQFAREKFDLIHYPHFNSPLFSPWPSVCTIHDLTPLSFPGPKMKSSFRRLAYRAVFNGTLRRARRIITISAATKADLLTHFPAVSEKVATIYEGVDERFSSPVKNDIIKQIKSKFGLDRPFIFFIGVWREHKNVEGLVKAFDCLKKSWQLPHLLVLGGREDLHVTGVRKAIDASPFKQDIITPGYIADEDLPGLYASASVFAIPSFIEGFGLIGLEAQAAGSPVVAARTSSLPEILGDSAVYFDPRSPEDMATVLAKVLTDEAERERLILAGRENLHRFSWQECARKTHAVYAEAINGK